MCSCTFRGLGSFKILHSKHLFLYTVYAKETHTLTLRPELIKHIHHHHHHHHHHRHHRHKNSRPNFARAIGRFCDALSSASKAKEGSEGGDPLGAGGCDPEAFASEVHSAFEVFVSNWIQARELPVRGAVAEALGFMSAALTPDMLEAELPRVLPTLLQMLKREKPAVQERLEITHGLQLLLQRVTSLGRWPPFEPHLESVLQTIFPLACTPPDYQFPITVRRIDGRRDEGVCVGGGAGQWVNVVTARDVGFYSCLSVYHFEGPNPSLFTHTHAYTRMHTHTHTHTHTRTGSYVR